MIRLPTIRTRRRTNSSPGRFSMVLGESALGTSLEGGEYYRLWFILCWKIWILKQEKPNKISRSPGSIVLLYRFIKKKTTIGWSGSVSLFDFLFIKKGRKKSRENKQRSFLNKLPWFCKVNMALFVDGGGQFFSSFNLVWLIKPLTILISVE